MTHSLIISFRRSDELAGRNEIELAPMNNTPGLISISFGVPDSDPSATETFLDDDHIYDTVQEKESQMQAFNSLDNSINVPLQQITHSISPSETVALTENEMIFDDSTYAVNQHQSLEIVPLAENHSRELAYYEAVLTSNIGIKVSTSDIGTGEVSELEPDTPALVQVQKRTPGSRVTLESTDSMRMIETPGSVFDDPIYDMGLNLKSTA